jgi:hypothetical protein
MDPLSLIVGAVVSLITQVVKKYFGTSSIGSLAAMISLSVGAGFGMWYLKDKGLWDSFLQIIVASGAMYGLIVANAEKAVAGKFFK